LPSGAINYIGPYFNVTSDQQLVLPISLFLVGYVLGPIFFGPLSETYGRRIIMLSSFIVFTLFTMACALAPNWPVFLVFRLICGINASSAIAVVGGLYADVFGDTVIRGRAMAIFMAVSQKEAAKHHVPS
jgi:MFS family permease